MIEITPERFYKVGAYCFSAIAILSLVQFITNIGVIPLISLFMNGFQVVFNFALAGFFIYLVQSNKPVTNELSLKEIEEAFKDESSNIRKSKY